MKECVYQYIERECKHHWVIESPNGRRSIGTCIKCNACKSFANTLDDALPDILVDDFYPKRASELSNSNKTSPKLDKLPQNDISVASFGLLDGLTDLGVEILRYISTGVSPKRIKEILNINNKRYISERNLISIACKGNIYDLIKEGVRSEIIKSDPLDTDFVASNRELLEILTSQNKIDDISRKINIDQLEVTSTIKKTLELSGSFNRFDLTARYETWKMQNELVVESQTT